MKTTETALIIARRPDGRTFSVSLNDCPLEGREPLEQRQEHVTDSLKQNGNTIVAVHRIETELPPMKRKVRDQTVVITLQYRNGCVRTFCHSDADLGACNDKGLTARKWADKSCSPEAARRRGYTLLSRVEFDAEYEVEEE